MDNQNPKKRRLNIGLLALGVVLVLRMVVLIPVFKTPGRVQLIENNTYLELAISMLERGTYEGYSRDNIDLVRTPGYPLFAAGVLGLAGGNLAYLALAQVLLTFGTCALVYLAARRLFNETAAMAAAWLFALDPTSLFVALTALTETLFAFLLILSVYLLIRYRQERRLGWALASAAVLGVDTLVRPIGVWLVPLWAGFVVFAWPGTPWRRRMRDGALVLVVAWAVLVPWQLRNYFVDGQFTLTPVGEKTIRNWMIAPGLAEAKGLTRNQAVSEIASAEDEQAYLLEVIRTYPKPVLVAQLKGIFRTLVGFEYGTWTVLLDIDRRPGVEFVNAALARNLPRAARAGMELLREGYYLQFGITAWALGFDVLLYALLASSLLVFPRRREMCGWCWLLFVLVSGYLLIVPFAAGQMRFRVPADPLLTGLAGLGVAVLLGLGSRLRQNLRGRNAAEPGEPT